MAKNTSDNCSFPFTLSGECLCLKTSITYKKDVVRVHSAEAQIFNRNGTMLRSMER